MNPLLHEFVEVFQSPEGIPLSRHIDHSIHLIPGSTLPNAPTYKLVLHIILVIHMTVNDVNLSVVFRGVSGLSS
jgi:hypothetical protein